MGACDVLDACCCFTLQHDRAVCAGIGLRQNCGACVEIERKEHL